MLLLVRVTRVAINLGRGSPPHGALLVRLQSPPAEGAANAELIQILAKTLHVPRGSISIVAGERSRQKRVRIEGVSQDYVNTRLGSV